VAVVSARDLRAAAAPQPGPAADMRPDDAVEVARILGAWGVQGGIRVKPFSADPQALFSTKRWYIAPGEVQRPVPPAAAGKVLLPPPALLRVVQAREQGDAIVATTQELQDRDAAQALAGWRVFVARSSFPTPDEGEFYWVDLIGLSVVNRDGLALGTVSGLIETGPHCVLRIVSEATAGAADADEVLIPFVDAYVDKVDLPSRRITVDWDPSY
jgi:16S rRNA processing protein RimM